MLDLEGAPDILKVLREADRIIRRHGWNPRDFETPEAKRTAYSLTRALQSSDPGVPLIANWRARKLVEKASGFHSLPEWEVYPLRTEREVREALWKAIEACGGKRPRLGGWRVGGVA